MQGSRLRWVVGGVLDVVTVTMSVVDVGTDVLVAREYYMMGTKLGRRLFVASTAIFVMAQATYSLLFTSTYAKAKCGTLRRVVIFACVFPVAQLVPLFTWLESFHFSRVTSFVEWCGLEATTKEEESGDELWSFIRAKYASHSGFLAEAVVEALPQAILQTFAFAVLGSASPVMLASVLMSVTVLASKAYVVSYSVDRRVCCFNALCFVADLLVFFATAAWLATQDDTVTTWLIWSFLWASATLAVGAFMVLIFVVCDDHLKQWRSLDSRPDIDTIWFELYIVRPFIFLCALLPLIVGLAGCRLVFVPIFVFGSLDPEHAQHYDFYSFLFAFALRDGDPDRIGACTAVIDAARRSASALPAKADADTVRLWAVALTTPDEWRPKRFVFGRSSNLPTTRRVVSQPVEPTAPQPQSAPPPTTQRSKWRKTLDSFWVDIAARSDILSFFDRRFPLGGAPPTLSFKRVYLGQSVLVIVGTAALGVGVLIFCAFLPVALLFESIALVYTPLQFALASDHNSLASVLTAALFAVCLPIVLLAPHCHTFRTRLYALADASELRPVVYDAKAVRGAIVRRYLAARVQHKLRDALALRLRSTFLADHVLDDLLRGQIWFGDHTSRGRADLWRLLLPAASVTPPPPQHAKQPELSPAKTPSLTDDDQHQEGSWWSSS